MKNRGEYIKLLWILVVLINCQIVYSQKDSVAQVKVYTQPKTLQFGNDFYHPKKIKFNNISDKGQVYTEFYKYYDHKNFVYDPMKDPKRLFFNTVLFTGAAVASFGILWVMPESFTHWDKEEMLEYGMFQRWKDNVTAGPVWDDDDIVLNWVMHPWAGAIYFMSARGSGYNKWESFAYSVIMSTLFWEYGVEAFAEIPSWQDLIITPVLGSIIGEQFFRWKGNIIKNDKRVLNSKILGGTSMFLMDPFNQVLNGLGYETKNKVQTYSAIAPIEYDFVSQKTIWGLQVVMTF